MKVLVACEESRATATCVAQVEAPNPAANLLKKIIGVVAA